MTKDFCDACGVEVLGARERVVVLSRNGANHESWHIRLAVKRWTGGAKEVLVTLCATCLAELVHSAAGKMVKEEMAKEKLTR